MSSKKPELFCEKNRKFLGGKNTAEIKKPIWATKSKTTTDNLCAS